MKIHHIGIAAKDLKEAVTDFGKNHTITYQSEEIYDSLQDASLVYIETNEGLNVEFISGNKVHNIVDKRIHYYHLCYEVKDLEKAIDKFVNNKSLIVSKPKPALLFKNRRVAFIHTTNGMIELLEEES